MSFGALRVHLDAFLKVVDGFLVAAHVLVDLRQVEVPLEALSQLVGDAVRLYSLRELLGHVVDVSEVVVGGIV
jgi:hypothetical protein